MGPGGAALAGAGVSLAVAAGFSAAVAWAGPLDNPRARGLHATPTVTSGGLAAIAGAGAGLLAFAALAGEASGLAKAALALGLAGALGLLGALDDLVDLGAKGKLLAQLLFGLVFTLAIGRIEALPLAPGLTLPLGPFIGALGTILWLVVATNAVNFMDGVDGLASGSLAIVLAALAAASLQAGAAGVAGAALAGAGALVGFTPWNLPLRRLFQGDAGSLFSGFLAAGLAVVAAERVSVYFMPMALTPFLTDVLLTLLARTRRGERFGEAHREHLFQLWLTRRGRAHRDLSLRVWAIVGLYAAAALAAERAPEGLRPLLFALGVVVAAAFWTWERRRLTQ